MLAANVCAAEFLIEHAHPALFRVHDGPSEDRLESLRAMLKDFALQLPGGAEPQPGDYAALLDKIKGRADAPLLQTVLLRSMKQAIYSPDNIGHFGLAYDAYTHFTSPIRRYPDLLTHRAIKAVLKGESYDPKEPWSRLGEHCSMTERRADEATRDVAAWLKCYYMKDRLGEEFAGTVSGVTSFGIFVTLDEVFVEGLVHISDLGQDYFHFDPTRHQIVGERTRRRFQLADRVDVKVARVDIETSRIDFVLTGERLKKVRAEEPAPAPLPPGAVRPAMPPLAAALERVPVSRPVQPIEPPPGKVIVSFSSLDPPTTPLEGLGEGGARKNPAQKGEVVRSAGALLKGGLRPKDKRKT